MSLSVTLFNALSGLQTNQSALQVVSSNVANVNTPDYTRKVHEQQTRVLDGMAMGVETADVVRKVDEFLLQELVRETAVLGQSDVRAQFFERMQTLFGTPGSNSSIANAITALGTALEDVANSPDVGAVQLTAVIAAETAARTLQDLATGVQELRAEADRQIADAVTTINDKLAAIAKLNGDIAHNEAQGLPTGDLKDQRDAAVRAVANFLAINQHEKSDGQIILLTKEGRNLVSGSNAAVLDYDAAGIMTATQTYPLNLSGIVINNGADIAGELSIGRLAGLIEMRDQTLPAMTAQLDQLAATLRDTLNRVHNRGANSPLGAGTGAGDPPVLSGTRLIGDPAGAITIDSVVTFQVLDANGQPATGPFTLGPEVTTANAIAAALDGYLSGGSGFGTASLNAGHLEIKLEAGYRLAIADQGTAAGGDARIDFDADGDGSSETYFGFSNFFGLNDLFLTPELGGTDFAVKNQGVQTGVSDTIKVRPDITASPDLLARGKLRGTAPDLHLGAGDAEIAAALAAAFDEGVLFPALTGGPGQTKTTLAGYAGTILSLNAAAADDATSARDFQSFVFENLQNRARSSSGVNIDEELANMVVFQNAYAASARVMQAANELFETLLSI
jgi:flagellar hook-associated protein 1 FlgK